MVTRASSNGFNPLTGIQWISTMSHLADGMHNYARAIVSAGVTPADVTFQSPDGYSVDFYVALQDRIEAKTANLRFNPLTGIQWISTGKGYAAIVGHIRAKFQSPDGYSVDFYPDSITVPARQAAAMFQSPDGYSVDFYMESRVFVGDDGVCCDVSIP